jgi:hypothetical protein
MATITSINPFPSTVRTAFEAYLSNPTYSNREQLSNQKWNDIHTILHNPTAFIITDQESINLKHRAQSDFELLNEKLYKKRDASYENPRYVVLKVEIFDIIAEEHLKLLHAGRNKVSLLFYPKFPLLFQL